MAARSSARRAGAVVALALAAVAACGRSDDVPPVPEELRRLEQREAGCIACHDGRRVPTLGPSVVATPPDHPPLGVVRFLRGPTGPDRARS
jgi:hypothetical protein